MFISVQLDEEQAHIIGDALVEYSHKRAYSQEIMDILEAWLERKVFEL